MQVSDVMTRDVDLVGPNTRLKDAAMRMRDDNCGVLPVGENDRLIGWLPTATSPCAAWPRGGRPAPRCATSCPRRSSNCFDDNDVAEADRLMSEHQVRRLPVLNRDNRMVGIVALADLTRADGDAATHAVRGISKATDVPRRSIVRMLPREGRQPPRGQRHRRP